MSLDLMEADAVEIPANAPQHDLAAFASELLRQVGELDAETAALEARQDAEIRIQTDRIRTAYAPQLDRVARRRAVLEGALGALADRLEYGKKRTLALANGEIGHRTVPAKLVMIDPDAALAWARKALPDAIKVSVKESVVHADLVKHYKATGEEPTGCEIVAASEALVIKPRAPEVASARAA